MKPFKIEVPNAVLEDLRVRLARTRWAPEFGNDDWRYGTNRSELEALCAYSRDTTTGAPKKRG